MIQRADPWAEMSYNGFADATALPSPPPRRSRLPSRALVAGGVAAGLALGAALALVLQPQAGPQPTQQVARASMLAIEVNQPAPPPAPKSKGRLEVLSPELAQAAPRLVAASAPPRIVLPSAPEVACSLSDSVAEQLVCEDPALSRADRRLNDAYARALRSGALPRRELRNDQLDWLAARENAARRSPFEVRGLYEQRIEELNALAAEARG